MPPGCNRGSPGRNRVPPGCIDNIGYFERGSPGRNRVPPGCNRGSSGRNRVTPGCIDDIGMAQAKVVADELAPAMLGRRTRRSPDGIFQGGVRGYVGGERRNEPPYSGMQTTKNKNRFAYRPCKIISKLSHVPWLNPYTPSNGP